VPDRGEAGSPPLGARLLPKPLRALAIQLLIASGILALAVLLLQSLLTNMARQGIKTGFGFLAFPANFGIAQSAIAYSPADSYARALLVGLVNTLIVITLGIVIATVLGTFIGIARRSSNWLVSRLAAIYVETVRNVPLLVQLIVWWDVLKISAPPPRLAWQPLPHLFVSNRGIVLPSPVWGSVHLTMLAAVAAGLLLAWLAARLARRYRTATDRSFRALPLGIALVAGPPLAVFLAAGAPFTLDLPTLKGFNFTGGQTISPEFAALVAGLSCYTASYIAEIVRGGIAAVSRGQSEAAAALGLRRGQALRLVVLPQALRAIVPPLIAQYLSLAKNSSLGVAIAFPDLVSVGNTVLNQTGQAVEVIAIEMTCYLTLSLAISALLNWYNRRLDRGSHAMETERPADHPRPRRETTAEPRRRFAHALAWMRVNLFGSPTSALLTVAGSLFLWWVLLPALAWAAEGRFVAADGPECREAGGACWAFIGAWSRFLLFGRFPLAEQWRPLLVILLFLAMMAATFRRRLPAAPLVATWASGFAGALLLMRGGIAGLEPVETPLWNGLPLTLILAVGSMIAAFPIALILALGRRSARPVLRALCVGYIELIRGVPLITILFMTSIMLPMLAPSGFTLDKLLRAGIAFCLFSAAYLAEAIRGGLQSVPAGQYEAAAALGLGYWRITGLIILPQALRIAIPGLVNTFIGTFKDTSLVVIVGLFDLLSTAKIAIEDPVWQGFYREAYVVVAAIFFVFCFTMSRFSQRLERQLGGGKA
jgi:general L-amino acid transport system permease protein